MTNHTVSLTQDEEAEIKQYMKKLSLKHHQILKLAIRSFLHPHASKFSVDGKEVINEDPLAHDPKDRFDVIDEPLNIGAD